jgi:hypothetical protein
VVITNRERYPDALGGSTRARKSRWAAAMYLLLGIVWSLLFYFVAIAAPDAFD